MIPVSQGGCKKNKTNKKTRTQGTGIERPTVLSIDLIRPYKTLLYCTVGFMVTTKSRQRWKERSKIYFSVTEDGCYLVKIVCLEDSPVEQLNPRAHQIRAQILLIY